MFGSSAGINLLFLLAIKIEDLKKNDEAFRISKRSNCIDQQKILLLLVIQLNALLGKKGRSLRDLTDYWDVATYFELHAVQGDWTKACLAALHMYLLNPPIWYMKSTINNLKMLHQATRLRDQQRQREESPMNNGDENIYSFWIDFFTDAIHSTSTTGEDNELPAQIPVE
jgi:MAP3K TRAFs-binding domain